MKPRIALVCCLALVMFLSAATPLKIGSITLEKLTHTSDIIVLATVQAVDEVGERERVASATVEAVWKGKPGDTVKFRAHSTWACDISKAIQGERVALFLAPEGDDGVHSIMHAGRGRMPIVERDGVTYLAIWSRDVRLPKGTPSSRGRRYSENLFSFGTVEELVRATVKKQREEELSGNDK